MEKSFRDQNKELIELLNSKVLSPFDLIFQEDIREKLVDLVLNGVPDYADYETSILFRQLYKNFLQVRVDHVKVVVFGGGTGLSNIIGGDCRQAGWANRPFNGLKDFFPETKAVVCVTDDGGSTGELLKDIPIIALGDIRHVLLSSIQLDKLIDLYDLSRNQAKIVAGGLSMIFNYRFDNSPQSSEQLFRQCGADLDLLPTGLSNYLINAVEACFQDSRIKNIFNRSHCLGNIIVLSAFLSSLPEELSIGNSFHPGSNNTNLLFNNLSALAKVLGAGEDAVLPSTLTPAQLRFLYTNGVQVTGEYKSSTVQRGFPVNRVFIDFCDTPYVPEKILDYIKDADILIMAPGSLYSSIIPVLQVPGIADAVRGNGSALKLLISNLWVQSGETDQSISDPERKFHVSDMIRAYERNLPGGTQGLFEQILCLSLKDVPGSVIQNYAVEGKVPIYLDKDILHQQGFEPIECGFFSRNSLVERQVIQHDPDIIAQTVKSLYLTKKLMPNLFKKRIGSSRGSIAGITGRKILVPSQRYRQICNRIDDLKIIADSIPGNIDIATLKLSLVDIIWNHKDIPLDHLDNIEGLTCINVDDWRRDQRWDNVFSFYDPEDGYVKIRQDRFEDTGNLEIPFLIALGQSLLGDYAAEKKVELIQHRKYSPGRVFHLYLREKKLRRCYFSDEKLTQYLSLARMIQQQKNLFTRLVSGEEGFTPPGLLFGVMYAWYLDNSFASYIEYKMSVMKVRQTDLIPEQMKTMKRRMNLITFFRESVFGKGALSLRSKI